MRSHSFINSLLYLVIQLVAKESKAKENNAGIRRVFILFLDKDQQALPSFVLVNFVQSVILKAVEGKMLTSRKAYRSLYSL